MLRITRAADTRIYGGTSLDPDNMENTADHVLWIRKVTDLRTNSSVLINCKSSTGVSERVLKFKDEYPMVLGSGIKISLEGIQNHHADTPPFCEMCGRGDPEGKRMVPQAKLGLTAPDEYRWVRHDANLNRRK